MNDTMNETIQSLDPLTLPLQGVSLIEASAGTGKTHSIGGLYLRLLLERGLSVDQILVVTFTKAATEELRSRVRGRIRELLHLLEGRMESDDEAMQAFVALARQTETPIQRLQDSLIRMDESAIFTIHGFCQRVLQEHALESGVLFDSEFVGSDKQLLQTVVEDFWRHCIEPLPRAIAVWVRGQWASPADLQSTLRALLQRPDAQLALPPGTEPHAKLQIPEALITQAQDLAKVWQRDQSAIMASLLDAKGLKRNNGNGLKPDALSEAAQSVSEWFGQPVNLALPKAFRCFSASYLAQEVKKNGEPPQQPFFDQVEAFMQAMERLLAQLYAQLLVQARDWTLKAIEQRKQERRVMDYDDLLRRLDLALASEQGGALAQALRLRYPVALIDEFQDTDQLQYRIFHTLYAGDAKTGLFMIGDPKQAIYSFRGADIFTYIRARQDTAPQHRYTLGKNWRSARQLVEAVNHLFDKADNPFQFEDIPFHRADAAGKADERPLLIEDGQEAPFRFWLLPSGGKKITKGKAEPLIAEACADEIVRLLTLAAEGKATLHDRPLGAGDIALLVRDRYEAAAIRSALQQVGVGSVIQGRESVLGSDEAQELALLLRGVLNPGNERYLRAACATSLLGMDAHTLHQLNESPERWEALHERFDGYHRAWRQQGFMAMFMRLIHQQQVPRRLLSGPQGERRLTNLLHLAELLQGAARQQESPERLLRWFADQRAEPDGDAEDQQLMLESDEHLVRIVTIHSSKGLQYPLVFLPYLFRGKPVKEAIPLNCYDPKGQQAVVDLGSAAFDRHWQQAEQERLAEDARLAYVALTRAEHRCYLPWGFIYGADQGLLPRLLHPDGMADDERIMAELQGLSGGDGSMAVESLPEPSHTRLTATGAGAGPNLRAALFSKQIERGWRITSYSGLVAGLEQPAAERLAEGPAGGEEVKGFPAGIRAGLFLHSLLEHLDFPSAEGEVLRAEVLRQLDGYDLEPQWAEAAEQLVHNLLDTPLDAAGTLRLRELTAARRRNEMAFHYPLAHLHDQGLNGVLARFPDYVSASGPLTFNPVQGLMIGFIDLVFEHQGRYYLADYKSNYLGSQGEGYNQEGLRRAMAAHRYDLQYLIYAVALHRYLGQRIRDYDYERHFGGAYYLFPRGMSAQTGPQQGVYFDRPDGKLIDALDRLFRGEL